MEKRSILSDSDLKVLELIALENSTQAQTEFYHRYRSFLLQVCRKRCLHFDDGEHLAEDIFQNTMLKALKGVKSLYAKLPKEHSDVSRIVKAWLIVIARNELRSFLRLNPDQKYLADPFRIKSEDLENELTTFTVESSKDNLGGPNHFEKAKLDEALSKLSDRDRHILMAYMEYYDQTEPNRHLPDDVIQQLCNTYNTTPENLRQIKGRTIRKLMEWLN